MAKLIKILISKNVIIAIAFKLPHEAETWNLTWGEHNLRGKAKKKKEKRKGMKTWVGQSLQVLLHKFF